MKVEAGELQRLLRKTCQMLFFPKMMSRQQFFPKVISRHVEEGKVFRTTIRLRYSGKLVYIGTDTCNADHSSPAMVKFDLTQIA